MALVVGISGSITETVKILDPHLALCQLVESPGSTEVLNGIKIVIQSYNECKKL